MHSVDWFNHELTTSRVHDLALASDGQAGPTSLWEVGLRRPAGYLATRLAASSGPGWGRGVLSAFVAPMPAVATCSGRMTDYSVGDRTAFESGEE